MARPGKLDKEARETIAAGAGGGAIVGGAGHLLNSPRLKKVAEPIAKKKKKPVQRKR